MGCTLAEWPNLILYRHVTWICFTWAKKGPWSGTGIQWSCCLLFCFAACCPKNVAAAMTLFQRMAMTCSSLLSWDANCFAYLFAYSYHIHKSNMITIIRYFATIFHHLSGSTLCTLVGHSGPHQSSHIFPSLSAPALITHTPRSWRPRASLKRKQPRNQRQAQP